MNELISKIKKILPELEVTDYLKRGGQKVVYSGRHSVHGQVVIKIIQASNEDETKRGLREIETTQNLNSNYFAKLYQCGKLDANTNSIYVIEELIQGKDLKEIIQEQPSNKIAITESINSIRNSDFVVGEFPRIFRCDRKRYQTSDY